MEQQAKRKHPCEDTKGTKRPKPPKDDSDSRSSRESEAEIEIQSPDNDKAESDTVAPEKPRKLTADTEESAKKPPSVVTQKQAAVELFNSTALSEDIYERDFEYEFLTSFLEKSTKGSDSRTLYICGKPGTGKTATLYSALKCLSDFPEVHVLFFNGMNYADTKPFLVALNRKLCELAGTHHKEKKGFHEMAGQVHENLKAVDSHIIIVVDELDAFIGKTKDAMNIILDTPLYAPKTTLIGIANSLGFYSKISQYYSKFPGHKNEELIFESYTYKQIEGIIARKLRAHFNDTEIVEKLIKREALHHVAAKVASISGDIRAAFDVLKTAFQTHAAKGEESPISMREVAEIINTKYRSKLATILHGLPREHQMIAAAIYVKIKREGKEFYKYDEIYAKTVSITGQLGLSRAAFSDFCESVKMLEFYGVLKAISNAKNMYGSKIKVIVEEEELKDALGEIAFFKEYLLSPTKNEEDLN